MKINLFFAVVGLILVSCINVDQQSKTAAAEADAVSDGVFLHVSSNDPHRVLMALRMAELMSDDHDVLIYFDIKGIEVVLKDSPDIAYASFPSSHLQTKKLIESGVLLQACPGCLEAAGKTSADLMEGVTLADKKAFLNFTEGRILTLDY